MADKLQNTGTGLGFLERILTLVAKYRIWDFIKAFVVLVMLAIAVGLISRPEWIFEQYDKWQQRQHTELINRRDDISGKTNMLLDKALYMMQADRIMVLEQHNGTNGNGGLSFNKCSCTYEVFDKCRPLADQYQDINLSLLPFAYHLKQNGYWQGTVEDLKAIDKGLAFKMERNGTMELMAANIEGITTDLAFIVVSFTQIDPDRDWDELRLNLRHLSMELGVYLELGRQK